MTDTDLIEQSFAIARLAAYITAEWKGDIPAIVFNGGLDEAVREALRRNKPWMPGVRREPSTLSA
jgi:hypothetical protein